MRVLVYRGGEVTRMTLTAGAGSGGFSVRTGDLAAGSGQVLGQQQRCAQLAADVTALIAQMAGSTGHQGLTDALVTASQSGMQTYAVAGALYDHVASGLRRSADEYDRAEQAIIQQAQAAVMSPW
jgi:hypothetical protein